MNELPHIHVGVVRRLSDGRGGHTEIVVNVSRCTPATNPDACMSMARDLLDEIQAEVESRVSGAPRPARTPKVDASAFATYDRETGEKLAPASAAIETTTDSEAKAKPEPTELMAQLQASLDAAKAKTQPIWLQKIAEVGRRCTIAGKDPATRYTIKAIRGDSALVQDDTDPFADSFLAKIDALDVETRVPTKEESAAWRAEQGLPPETIPDPANVATHYEAFGVTGLTVPPLEDWNQPYTKTGGDSGGGQCKAVNTALSESGFGGKLRHRAAQTLIEEFGIQRGDIDTLDQLTKAEASLILEWFDKATADALAGLSLAMNGLAVAA